VIGVNGNGNEILMEHGVSYKDIPLTEGKIDIENVLEGNTERTKVIAIQRSKGYDQRQSIPLDEIEDAIKRVKEVHPNILIFVDKCYGEFVERREPIECGADLIAGSLIKNPGGGLAKIGGYIDGRK
ncbi:methionine gamma-lyase family protein, partial [Staphylococcus argenteus]|uniref:methionine gamma-lyase family protein n=1 Tax=Staphylococcus argenteus TaxID=985002 RepID=UPI00403F0CDA